MQEDTAGRNGHLSCCVDVEAVDGRWCDPELLAVGARHDRAPAAVGEADARIVRECGGCSRRGDVEGERSDHRADGSGRCRRRDGERRCRFHCRIGGDTEQVVIQLADVRIGVLRSERSVEVDEIGEVPNGALGSGDRFLRGEAGDSGRLLKLGQCARGIRRLQDGPDVVDVGNIGRRPGSLVIGDADAGVGVEVDAVGQQHVSICGGERDQRSARSPSADKCQRDWLRKTGDRTRHGRGGLHSEECCGRHHSECKKGSVGLGECHSLLLVFLRKVTSTRGASFCSPVSCPTNSNRKPPATSPTCSSHRVHVTPSGVERNETCRTLPKP